MTISETLQTCINYYTNTTDKVNFLLKIIYEYGYNKDLKQITSSEEGYDTIRFYALVLIGDIIGSATFQTSTDTEILAQQLNDVYEAEYIFRTDLEVCQYLTELQSETVGLLLQEGYGLPTLVDYTTRTSEPCCVIAQNLYEDLTREAEIIKRNNTDIKHPLFMPLTIKVLSS